MSNFCFHLNKFLNKFFYFSLEQERLHKEREAATARWAAAQQAERQQAQQPAWQQLLGLHPQPDQAQSQPHQVQSQPHQAHQQLQIGQKSPAAVPWSQREALAPSLLEIQAEEQRQAVAERKQTENLWTHEVFLNFLRCDRRFSSGKIKLTFYPFSFMVRRDPAVRFIHLYGLGCSYKMWAFVRSG